MAPQTVVNFNFDIFENFPVQHSGRKVVQLFSSACIMSDTIAFLATHFWATAITCSFSSFPNPELRETSNTANHFLSTPVSESEGTEDTAGKMCHGLVVPGLCCMIFLV